MLDTPTVSEVLRTWETQRGLPRLPYANAAVTYVSVPITSGRRFLDWWRREGRTLPQGSPAYETALRAHVILPNVQHAGAFIEGLRWRHAQLSPQPLYVDPTTCDVPGWTQNQYDEFWELVLRHHVKCIIFADGWEYSRGARREFMVAHQAGINCVDADMRVLTFRDGTARMEAAEKEINTLWINSAHDTQVIDQPTTGPRRDPGIVTWRLGDANPRFHVPLVHTGDGCPYHRRLLAAGDPRIVRVRRVLVRAFSGEIGTSTYNLLSRHVLDVWVNATKVLTCRFDALMAGDPLYGGVVLTPGFELRANDDLHTRTTIPDSAFIGAGRGIHVIYEFEHVACCCAKCMEEHTHGEVDRRTAVSPTCRAGSAEGGQS